MPRGKGKIEAASKAARQTFRRFFFQEYNTIQNLNEMDITPEHKMKEWYGMYLMYIEDRVNPQVLTEKAFEKLMRLRIKHMYDDTSTTRGLGEFFKIIKQHDDMDRPWSELYDWYCNEFDWPNAVSPSVFKRSLGKRRSTIERKEGVKFKREAEATVNGFVKGLPAGEYSVKYMFDEFNKLLKHKLTMKMFQHRLLGVKWIYRRTFTNPDGDDSYVVDHTMGKKERAKIRKERIVEEFVRAQKEGEYTTIDMDIEFHSFMGDQISGIRMGTLDFIRRLKATAKRLFKQEGLRYSFLQE